jgi:hypothetical protein
LNLGAEIGEIGNQLGVRQMPKAAAIISHGIGFPINLIEERYISVVALVEGLEAKETRCGTTGGGGAFSLQPDCCNIVRRVMDSGFPNVKFLRQNVMLSDTGGQFQFAVIDVAFGIVKGHQALLNVYMKGASP